MELSGRLGRGRLAGRGPRPGSRQLPKGGKSDEKGRGAHQLRSDMSELHSNLKSSAGTSYEQGPSCGCGVHAAPSCGCEVGCGCDMGCCDTCGGCGCGGV